MALREQTTEKEVFHETKLAQLPLFFDSLFNKLDCFEKLERKATIKEFSKEGDSNRSNSSFSNNLTEFKEALKSGIKSMEAFLQEAESTVSNEAQQYEELRQRAEVKVDLLEAQLQEKEEALRAKESAIRQLERSLTSKVQELEQCKREDGVAYRSNTSNLRLTSRICANLSYMVGIVPSGWDRLTEKENRPSLLEKQRRDFYSWVPDGGKGWPARGSDSRNGGDPPQKESSNLQLGESITAKIQEMEDQLNEKESLLEIRQDDFNNLRSKLDSFGNAPEGVVTLREEDVITLNLLANKEEIGMAPSKVQEKMTSGVEDWRELLMRACGK